MALGANLLHRGLRVRRAARPWLGHATAVPTETGARRRRHEPGTIGAAGRDGSHGAPSRSRSTFEPRTPRAPDWNWSLQSVATEQQAYEALVAGCSGHGALASLALCAALLKAFARSRSDQSPSQTER